MLATARSNLKPQRELALENLALRQQLAILQRCYVRRHFEDRHSQPCCVRRNFDDPCSQLRYDHRIREIVCETGNPRIFRHLCIPRSTTASWLSRGRRRVVSLDWQHDIASVLDENERLKRRAQRQTAIIRLLVVLLKLSGFRLDEQRLPDGKAKVLRAVERLKDALRLTCDAVLAQFASYRETYDVRPFV